MRRRDGPGPVGARHFREDERTSEQYPRWTERLQPREKIAKPNRSLRYFRAREGSETKAFRANRILTHATRIQRRRHFEEEREDATALRLSKRREQATEPANRRDQS